MVVGDGAYAMVYPTRSQETDSVLRKLRKALYNKGMDWIYGKLFFRKLWENCKIWQELLWIQFAYGNQSCNLGIAYFKSDEKSSLEQSKRS